MITNSNAFTVQSSLKYLDKVIILHVLVGFFTKEHLATVVYQPASQHICPKRGTSTAILDTVFTKRFNLLHAFSCSQNTFNSNQKLYLNSNCSCCRFQHVVVLYSAWQILLQPLLSFFSNHFPFVLLIQELNHQQHQSQSSGP